MEFRKYLRIKIKCVIRIKRIRMLLLLLKLVTKLVGCISKSRVNAIKLRQKGGKMGRRERQKWGGGRNEQG